MATPKSQRIGIWIIATFMIIGALGSSLMIVLSNQNQANDQTKIQKQAKEYQANIDLQTKTLSDKYFSEFNQFATAPAPFNADEVNSVYYIGWNPKGVVFDQSIKNSTSLLAPYPITPTSSVIDGWKEGVIDMKMGGVRELTIPSDKAYGATARDANIPANTPLKFIIMVIPKVDDVTMPPELLQYYQSQQSASAQ
jgi:FKBP-type peptidyl-prolyl cis-trans isomerase